MKAEYCRYVLTFRNPVGTSRGILTNKETFFIRLEDENMPGVYGIGECAVFRGLSCDDTPDYESKLKELCSNINNDISTDLESYPSIMFGLQTAIYDISNGGKRIVFPSGFTDGNLPITINGLVWMGTKEEMAQRINEKIKAGFTTIKLKVGAIDFGSELELVKYIRSFCPEDILTIRLDANGGFSPDDALQKLDALSKYGIHSIEQPIEAGQWDEMGKLCAESPIDIALDEELIGILDEKEKDDMLSAIKPKYIILKPSLIGGFSGAQSWMQHAAVKGIGGWITSALESNIGLNAIAQWTAMIGVGADMPQGLGTGLLYENNVESPLVLKGQRLYYDRNKNWILPNFDWR